MSVRTLPKGSALFPLLDELEKCGCFHADVITSKDTKYRPYKPIAYTRRIRL